MARFEETPPMRDPPVPEQPSPAEPPPQGVPEHDPPVYPERDRHTAGVLYDESRVPG